MRKIDSYFTRSIPYYQIKNDSNITNSKISYVCETDNRIGNINEFFELEKARLNYVTKNVPKNTKFSDDKYNNNTLYSISADNRQSYIYNIYKKKNRVYGYKNSTINNNDISKKKKYIRIETTRKKITPLNIIRMIPNTTTGKEREFKKEKLENKIINTKNVRKFSYINILNNSNLNSSDKRQNHSFHEVKSLGNKNNITNRNTINADKKKSNKILKINYNINNNINLIIDSKKVKYIPKVTEIVFNKNKINLKNISSNKIVIKSNNNKRSKKASPRKSSFFFSYLPKSKIGEKNKKKIKKRNKIINNENKIILKNMIFKTFKEDFPIKIKYNRNYFLNKKLKPQIAFRMTLFKRTKIEFERYYLVNVFCSENIRNPDNKDLSEFYF